MFNKKVVSGVAFALLTASSAMAANNSLSGPYVGVQLGLAQPTATVEDTDCWYDCSAQTQSKTAAAGGIQGGFDMASGSFLYGVSAEYSFASSESSFKYAFNSSNGLANMQVKSKFKGVASVRGRVGLVLDNTAIVVSAGPASAQFDSELRDLNATTATTDDWRSSRSGSVSGLATGVSIEHALSSTLKVGLDVSQYSFKDERSHFAPVPGNTSTTNLNLTNHQYSLQTANLSLSWLF